MRKILLTNYYAADPLECIKRLVPEGFELIALSASCQEEVVHKAESADYLLAGGSIRINEEVLNAAPKLKMIHRSGVGLDSLDLKAIRSRGIPLYVNEGVNARSVAEHTLTLMLGTLRNIAMVNSMMHNGEWLRHDLGIRSHSLLNKQVGLVGMGNVASTVAGMLKGLGVSTVYTNPKRIRAEKEKILNVHFLPLSELLQSSDIVSLHCPLKDNTKHLISNNELAKMKSGAILINTARGGLIDEDALIESLKSGRLTGAGLDVFEHEPLPINHPLRIIDNVLLTPHIGSITAESFVNILINSFKNIVLFDQQNYEQIMATRVV